MFIVGHICMNFPILSLKLTPLCLTENKKWANFISHSIYYTDVKLALNIQLIGVDKTKVIYIYHDVLLFHSINLLNSTDEREYTKD